MEKATKHLEENPVGELLFLAFKHPKLLFHRVKEKLALAKVETLHERFGATASVYRYARPTILDIHIPPRSQPQQRSLF